jgi:hypothetical protein
MTDLASRLRGPRRSGDGPATDRETDVPATIGPPKLTCYRLWDNSPDLAPARSDREWMDATRERFAYRCTPLTIANASGWEMALPFAFEAAWDGGDAKSAVRFRSADPRLGHFVTSHSGHGIVTFHTGWLFKTSPGWAIWARGAPNTAKADIAALDGLVETDWLPFTFTMNWRFLRPAVVRFEAGEPFCFITLAPHGLLDVVQPVLARLEDDPSLKAAYETWSAKRADFSERLEQREDEAVAEKWQRTYVQGHGGVGGAKPAFHLSKRRLNPPRWRGGMDIG